LRSSWWTPRLQRDLENTEFSHELDQAVERGEVWSADNIELRSYGTIADPIELQPDQEEVHVGRRDTPVLSSWICDHTRSLTQKRCYVWLIGILFWLGSTEVKTVDGISSNGPNNRLARHKLSNRPSRPASEKPTRISSRRQ
jgi:hypothetical protein